MEEKKIIRVLFGIPNEGHTEPDAYDNRLEMAIHMGNLQVLSHFGLKDYCGFKYEIPGGVEYQFSIKTVGRVFTAYAREQLAICAVENGFDYLYMVDDDMLTPADLFERLVRHDVDIVAPLAFTRTYPHKPVIYNLVDGYDNVTNQKFYINYVVDRYPKDTLVQCDAVGFGAVLIKVDCLRNMPRPWMMTTSGAGEDIHFCHSAGKYGFKIFMDTSTKIVHLGDRKKISEETYEQENNVDQKRKDMGDVDKYGRTFGKVSFRKPTQEEGGICAKGK